MEAESQEGTENLIKIEEPSSNQSTKEGSAEIIQGSNVFYNPGKFIKISRISQR